MTPAKPLPSDEERQMAMDYYTVENSYDPRVVPSQHALDSLAALLAQVRAEASQSEPCDRDPRRPEERVRIEMQEVIDAVGERAEAAEQASQEKDSEIEKLRSALEAACRYRVESAKRAEAAEAKCDALREQPPSDEERAKNWLLKYCIRDPVYGRNIRALTTLLTKVRAEASQEKDAERLTAREWADLAAADGRYLPHHSVGWLVVNGKVCRKHHTDFINDPCVFEEGGFSGDRDAWKWKAEAAEAERDALRERVRVLEEALRPFVGLRLFVQVYDGRAFDRAKILAVIDAAERALAEPAPEKERAK